jgi:hypothetical protein
MMHFIEVNGMTIKIFVQKIDSFVKYYSYVLGEGEMLYNQLILILLFTSTLEGV